MAIPVIMPKQGQSVETCIITRWFKDIGDKVSKGDILLSYETDKAAFDLESPADGTLIDIFFGEGDEVPVLENVAALGNKGEETGHLRPGALKPGSEAPPAQKQSGEVTSDNTAKYMNKSNEVVPSPGSVIKISPRALRLAEDKKVDYTAIKGSGPEGRIVVSDIEMALSRGASSEYRKTTLETDFYDKPLGNIRKIIAKAMHSSLQSSAQLTHHMSADVRKLIEARRKIKENTAAGNQDITLNDILCFCVIRAIAGFPEINSHFLGDTMRTFKRVHLGIAVDTQRGLMVPTIRNADMMNLSQLSTGLRSAADACRKGNIDPELIQSTSASFTVSNLGNYGVEMFTPVINLPQVAILGICTIINRPVDLGNNTFGFVPYIGLSLTYDHRAVDGGPATLFLKEIKKQIENFNYE
jgi:pyruvate dehydrogenase E2 component (dihydrolipoamide acetyltransferase)